MSEINTEGGMLEQTIKFYLRKSGFPVRITTNTRLDFKEGTDMIVTANNKNNVPTEYRIDPTTNFRRKMDEGRTIELKEKTYSENALNIKVTFGYRIGNIYKTHDGKTPPRNCRHDFEKPTLVIGITDYNGNLMSGGAAEHEFAALAHDIIQEGTELYDTHEAIYGKMENGLIVSPGIIDNPINIKNEKKQTPKMQEIAIKYAKPEQLKEVAKSLKSPNVDIQKRLAKKDGILAMEMFPNACVDVQIAAIKQNINAYKKIKNPSEEVEAFAQQCNKAYAACEDIAIYNSGLVLMNLNKDASSQEVRPLTENKPNVLIVQNDKAEFTGNEMICDYLKTQFGGNADKTQWSGPASKELINACNEKVKTLHDFSKVREPKALSVDQIRKSNALLEAMKILNVNKTPAECRYIKKDGVMVEAKYINEASIEKNKNRDTTVVK